MSFKDHDLASTFDFAGVRYEERSRSATPAGEASSTASTPSRSRSTTPSSTTPTRPEMVKGVILGHAPRLQRPRLRRRRLHRRRRPGLLHRRQHQGIRRVLRWPARGVPPVHAAVQRHGHRASCTATSRSSAASTACASAAARRSAWPATSPSPRTWRSSARPAPATARPPTAAAPTSCRSSSASRRPWRAARSASTGARTRRTAWACSPTSVPALKVDGQFVPNPMVVTDRWVDDMRPPRLRRERRPATSKAAAKALMTRGEVDLSLLDKAVDALVYLAGHDHARLPHQDRRERAQAQAGALGPQPRDQPRLAGTQHDDRRQRRVPRLQRGHASAAARPTSSCSARLAEGAKWGDELTEEILARAHGKKPAGS